MTNVFREDGYLEHNRARLEHLASLKLPLWNRSVLVLGAGIGDHVMFFAERGCNVIVTDGRPDNVRIMKEEHPQWNVACLDVEKPFPWDLRGVCDVVHCYGLLYHCGDPIGVLANIAEAKPKLVLIETCVSKTANSSWLEEEPNDPRNSIHGRGSRPARQTIWRALQQLFPFVCMPLTQPNHGEFPLEWKFQEEGESRAVFIASTDSLFGGLLTTDLPMTQSRC